MTELKANRQYKDRVFRMIFNSREKLLELYNAMNGTDYESAEDLDDCHPGKCHLSGHEK